MDSFLRIWGTWNNELTKEQCEKTIILKYEFPSLDKKSIGSWRIVSLLYDDATNELTSYNSSMFTVQETSYDLLIMAGLFGLMVLLVLLFEYKNGIKRKIMNV